MTEFTLLMSECRVPLDPATVEIATTTPYEFFASRPTMAEMMARTAVLRAAHQLVWEAEIAAEPDKQYQRELREQFQFIAGKPEYPRCLLETFWLEPVPDDEDSLGAMPAGLSGLEAA